MDGLITGELGNFMDGQRTVGVFMTGEGNHLTRKLVHKEKEASLKKLFQMASVCGDVCPGCPDTY